MKGTDFLALQETHSTTGRVTAASLPSDIRAFWSHGSTTVGGVGLWLSSSFLSRFGPVAEQDFTEIEQGRVAVLRLDGPQGSLDVFSIYMPTGAAKEERARIRLQLARHIRPQDRALSVIIGDWNFVREREDRYSTLNEDWTGERDSLEHQEMVAQLLQPFGLYEMMQPAVTHRSVLGVSRLDRAYINAHVVEQEFRPWTVAAMDWTGNLSAHRPLELARRQAQGDDHDRNSARPLPQGPARHPQWPLRVVLQWGEMRRQDQKEDTAIRRLLLLKDAISEVTWTMHYEGSNGQATLSKDKIGLTVKALRSLEQGKTHAWKKCVEQYPTLVTITGRNRGGGIGDKVRAIKEHIKELLKETVKKDVEDLAQEARNLPEEETSRRRGEIWNRIKRLQPNTSTQLSAILNEDSQIVTDPQAIVEGLRRHWAEVFARKPTNEVLHNNWMRELKRTWQNNPLDPDESRWRITKKDVEWAIKHARSTSPGPDGISSHMWRRMGRTANKVLYEVASDMQHQDFNDQLIQAYSDRRPGEHEFNTNLLFCIPKKPTLIDQAAGPVYKADGTRPISVADFTNRIIAAAFKRRWEPILGKWVSEEQRGFIQGRSMLDNVIELEHGMMENALKELKPIAVLIDFRAAFPSVSHDYMHRTLEDIGLPRAALRVIKNFYDGGRCKMVHAGGRWEGFDMNAGIRQGCPLAPITFSVVMDILLRRIKGVFEDTVLVRAFADDIGIVLRDRATQLPKLAEILKEFGDISGMKINLKKTEGILLTNEAPEDVRAEIATYCQEWGELPLVRAGKYLGYYVGPDKSRSQWLEVHSKLLERSDQWDWRSSGMHFASIIYNTYLATIPSFKLQLTDLTEETKSIEKIIMRKAIPSVGQAFVQEDLWQLKDSYSMPHNFTNLQDTDLAAKGRMYIQDLLRPQGPILQKLRQDLRHIRRTTTFLDREMNLRHWLDEAPAEVVYRAVDKLKAMQISPSQVFRDLAQTEEESEREKRTLQAKRKIQKHLTIHIQKKTRKNQHHRIRGKLARWKIDGPPRQTAEEYQKFLKEIVKSTPPRVRAAVISTAWNRWATERRWQRRNADSNCCVFHCRPEAEDSIEHYQYCPTVREAHWRHLRMRPNGDGSLLPAWILGKGLNSEDKVRAAIGAYATYKTYNSQKFGKKLNREEVIEAFGQSVKEAAMRHTKAENVVLNTWRS